MRFSNKELKDLFFAWLIISLAFAILLGGGIGIFLSLSSIVLSFGVSVLTVGIAFIFHEIMHKFMAQRYGLWAEFRAFYPMLFLSILFSFLGFIIAAPGAVVMRGYNLTREKNGKISLAGPLINIILGIIFLILILSFNSVGVLGLFFSYGLTINSLLAVFNLLPFFIFDGKKVYDWNKTVYFISMTIAVLLYFSSYII